MSLLDDFVRVSRARPCPVCSKADWCLVSRDDPPSKAVCSRVESGRRWKDAGYFHRLRDSDGWRQRRVRTVRTITIPAAEGSGALLALARRYHDAVTPEQADGLSRSLGVSAAALARLRLGWTGRSWSFPMRDAGGHVRGIRLRFPDGTKLSVRGGREGLFIPIALTDNDPLLICEGPTDCAALLDLGFDAVGRPSCTGGTGLIVALVRARKPASVVVVADADAPGQRGAAALASVLAAHCRDVRVITPVAAKDAREWARRGGTRRDVLDAIGAVEPVRPALRVRAKGGR